ncbi:hypothetical protein BV25DRAFT_1995244 [Artomyces pyxidatus]|uniref:Uncharacterized protein n=1 Tax=Artomyces pyxidatus TaxID=48021 RepID=A0ACB8SMA4_9AGAM|nr:hypothetical protein BV25DRAFT_1995244 [Artomyces pyxidatus]
MTPSSAPPPDDLRRYPPSATPEEIVGANDLLWLEIRWRDRQVFLESRGYLLRPRLRPGWIPSWLTNGKRFYMCEDGIWSPARDHLIDATRISDGKLVYIKRVTTGDPESTIALSLSSETLRLDPINHAVPILDHFHDPEEQDVSYIVMPFLRLMNQPTFQYVGEVLDFGEQILEGLVFLHEHGVAHRDCSLANLMMDGTAMYPQGHHPIHQSELPDLSADAPFHPRLFVGVRYYYVDFGISSTTPPGAPSLVVGTLGRDQEVPELSDDVPYDPFKVDIFTIGNVFRREFDDKYSNLGFLEPFIKSMTTRDPAARPSAKKMLKKWRQMRRQTTALRRHWRLAKRKETIAWTAVASGLHLIVSPRDDAAAASAAYIDRGTMSLERQLSPVAWPKSGSAAEKNKTAFVLFVIMAQKSTTDIDGEVPSAQHGARAAFYVPFATQ